MTKKLKDLTLSEVMGICSAHPRCKGHCPLFKPGVLCPYLAATRWLRLYGNTDIAVPAKEGEKK